MFDAEAGAESTHLQLLFFFIKTLLKNLAAASLTQSPLCRSFKSHVKVSTVSQESVLKNLPERSLYLTFTYDAFIWKLHLHFSLDLLLLRMDLSSLLADLHLPPSPPITDLLSSLSLLIGSCPDSSLFTVVSKLERLFQTSDPEWLLSSNWSSVGGLGAGPEQAYLSVCRALIGRAALPLGDDDVWSPSDSEYLGIGARAEAVSRALTTLLRILGKNREEGGASERVLLTVAPDICVFAVTHFQVRVSGYFSPCDEFRESDL